MNGSASVSLEDADVVQQLRLSGLNDEVYTMRIAFTGPDGSGKTTLVNALAETIDYPRVPEYVDEVLKSMDLWKGNTIESLIQLKPTPIKYFEFQQKLTDAKLKAENMYGAAFVEDRTHIDGLAYTLFHLREHVSDEVMADFIDKSVSRSKYDLIFYVPRSESVLGEGRRVTSRNHHVTYDFLLRGIYSCYGIDFIEIESNSIEARTREVLDHVYRRGGP